MEKHPPLTTARKDRASNVTRATKMRKMWEKAAQERIAAEAKLQFIREQMSLEQTAEIEGKEEDAMIRQTKLVREQQDKDRHRAQLEEEYALEQMRRDAELRKRQRRAEMSMRMIHAWQDMETAQRNEKLLRSKRKSVSKNAAPRDVVLQDKKPASRRDVTADKRDTNGNEIIREERVNPEMEPATSKINGVSRTAMYSAKSDEPSYVSVPRPCATPGTNRTMTNVNEAAKLTNQGQETIVSSMIHIGKVNPDVIDWNLLPLNENVEADQDVARKKELVTEEEKLMVCEEQGDLLTAPVTSKNMIMTMENFFCHNKLFYKCFSTTT